MTFGTESGEAPIVVELSGDLGFNDRERVLALLPPPPPSGRVVFDCTHVTSMDSAILAAFVIYRRQFQIAGRDPLDIVCLVSERVERLFEIVGLTRMLTVVRTPSVEASLD